jgi:hypothetical protein
VPENTLRLAEVQSLATRDEILDMPIVLKSLATIGVQGDKISDYMIVAGRVFCCDGPNEGEQLIWFYVPSGISVTIGDIVELRSGPELRQSDPSAAPPNTVTRIVQRPYDKEKYCRWVPENEKLWTRVLYCDWMEADGWRQQSGLFNVWIKD